jgi:large subunit ribosomal protein L1
MEQADKRQNRQFDKVGNNKLYALPDALGLVKVAVASSMSLSMWPLQLGIDAKIDQVVRGAVVVLSKQQDQACCRIRPGAKAEAKAAGADIVGMDDLAAKYQGWQDGL